MRKLMVPTSEPRMIHVMGGVDRLLVEATLAGKDETEKVH
jgi:hypothetical protein